jgi:excisionase family DNA binding protein
MEEKILLNKRDVAALLSVSIRTVENLITANRLPVRHIGGRTLISRKALERFARQDHPTHSRPNLEPSEGSGEVQGAA